MAKRRLSYRRFWAIVGPLLLLAATAAFLAWIVGGCVEKVAGVDLSKNTPLTASGSTTGADSPVTVITFAGAAPWGCGAMLLALSGFVQLRKRTAVKALDRVIGAIESEYRASAEHDPVTPRTVLKCLKHKIGRAGLTRKAKQLTVEELALTCAKGQIKHSCLDGSERLIRSRLKRFTP